MTEYYERRIKDLEEEIAKLRAREEAPLLSDTYTSYKVGCRENNSGGYFWLKEHDYTALRDAGFNIFPRNRAFYKTIQARSEDEAISMVKGDFWDITNVDPDSEGCNCCGSPFHFYVDDEFYWEDESSYSSIEPIILS